MSSSSLYLKQIEVGPMNNFVYLIGDPVVKEVFVIDPGWEPDEILETAEEDGFTVKGILLTHSHFDHIGALQELVDQTSATVYVHESEVTVLAEHDVKIKAASDGDKIRLGNFDISVIHTPGHTPGSQCFLVDGKLFTGDTLFINACGRCDLPGSDPEKMYYSLSRLAALDEATIVYPGHNYGDEPISTIGKEKKFNPYLQRENLEAFRRFRMKNGQ